MFVARVALRTRAEDRPGLVAQLQREEHEVPALFAGCRRFSLTQHHTDPHSLLLYEEWDDAATFEAYRRSEYFERSGAVLFPLIDGAPDTAYYEAQRVGP
jgi:quinol monooxygenase YgiN